MRNKMPDARTLLYKLNADGRWADGKPTISNLQGRSIVLDLSLKSNNLGQKERLKRRDCDRHGLGSKPTHAILLCLWKRHFTALSPA